MTQAELCLVAVGIPAKLYGEVPDGFSMTQKAQQLSEIQSQKGR